MPTSTYTVGDAVSDGLLCVPGEGSAEREFAIDAESVDRHGGSRRVYPAEPLAHTTDLVSRSDETTALTALGRPAGVRPRHQPPRDAVGRQENGLDTT